jgi:dCTP deaminase
MVLSDIDIIERIGQDDLSIEPYEESNVEPASVDLRLGEDHKLVRAEKGIVDAGGEDDDVLVYDELESPLIVSPGTFILTTTLERVEIPDDLVAHVLGRSSLGRLGISVHQTAGYIDPGFEGQITLELSNHGPAPVSFSPGQRICQIVFEELSSPALNPYGGEDSQYQNQSGATVSGMGFRPHSDQKNRNL